MSVDAQVPAQLVALVFDAEFTCFESPDVPHRCRHCLTRTLARPDT